MYLTNPFEISLNVAESASTFKYNKFFARTRICREDAKFYATKFGEKKHFEKETETS